MRPEGRCDKKAPARSAGGFLKARHLVSPGFFSAFHCTKNQSRRDIEYRDGMNLKLIQPLLQRAS